MASEGDLRLDRRTARARPDNQIIVRQIEHRGRRRTAGDCQRLHLARARGGSVRGDRHATRVDLQTRGADILNPTKPATSFVIVLPAAVMSPAMNSDAPDIAVKTVSSASVKGAAIT